MSPVIYQPRGGRGSNSHAFPNLIAWALILAVAFLVYIGAHAMQSRADHLRDLRDHQHEEKCNA